MRSFGIALGIVFLSLSAYAQQQDFDTFSKKFVSGYSALNLPELDLSYVNNLQHIGSADEIKKQCVFFINIKSKLNGYDPKLLNASQKTDYELMMYETTLNLQRLALEQQWIKHRPAKITANGIINVPDGKQWYTYYLKRWVSDDVTPDQIFNFGLQEVKRVQGHIETIREQTGLSEDDFYNHLNDPSFFITDSNKVRQAFEHTKAIVYSNLPKLFADTQITALKIEQGTQQALAQTPGYYDNNTFYYNLFNKPYNNRQVDWLFIHEAVPGHHYQACVISHTNLSAIQQLFFYYGFAEGWAAYTEELGNQLGVYATPYDELGKWQWDIVRSVRVPLDIGLNYYGWTDKQALDFWKKNIRGQDDIALREIARLRRWPAQAITYKYGALQILHWKEALQKAQGNDFNIRNFHSRVLNHGSLPIFMVKENVFRNKG